MKKLLNKKLKYIGTVEVVHANTVFTLLIKGENLNQIKRSNYIIRTLQQHVTPHYPSIETMSIKNDYFLAVLRKSKNQQSLQS